MSDQKHKILVAMTGKVDSTVAAYLLKKQGHQCIGIGISFFSADTDSLKGHCDINDLSKVQDVCNQLNIPFYGVNAQKNFEHYVLAGCVAARLAGIQFSPCVYCHQLMIKLLSEKAKLLKADRIASGHYSRVIKSSYDEFVIAGSMDEKNDQSYLLASVESTILDKLILPLSEINKTEVLKIYNTLNIESSDSNPVATQCLMSSKKLSDYIRNNVCKGLLEEGSFQKASDDSRIGEHKGSFQYSLGESKITTSTINSIDSSWVILKINPRSGLISLGPSEESRCSHLVLRDFLFNGHFNLSKPFLAYCKVDIAASFFPGIFYIKNNGTLMIELSQEQKMIFEGQFCAVYMKTGRGLRLVGGGIVAIADKIFHLKKAGNDEEDEFDEDNEKAVKKVRNDFSF